MRRLAILSTHPIQYNAPFFRMLDDDSTLKVLVFFSKTSHQVKFDPDFRREIVWDIPVTEGYDHVSHDAPLSPDETPIGSIRASRRMPSFMGGISRPFEGPVPLPRAHPGLVPWRQSSSRPGSSSELARRHSSHVYRHVDVAFSVGTATRTTTYGAV